LAAPVQAQNSTAAPAMSPAEIKALAPGLLTPELQKGAGLAQDIPPQMRAAEPAPSKHCATPPNGDYYGGSARVTAPRSGPLSSRTKARSCGIAGNKMGTKDRLPVFEVTELRPCDSRRQFGGDVLTDLPRRPHGGRLFDSAKTSPAAAPPRLPSRTKAEAATITELHYSLPPSCFLSTCLTILEN
jgi:hypothetical protein